MATRIEILKMLASGELTPRQAEMKLDGLRNVRKSTLLEVSKGDKVICFKSASLLAKFGNKKLTVNRIQYNEAAGFCRFTFKETGKNDWYYENFFGSIRKKQ